MQRSLPVNDVRRAEDIDNCFTEHGAGACAMDQRQKVKSRFQLVLQAALYSITDSQFVYFGNVSADLDSRS